jgi:hypothetical protein
MTTVVIHQPDFIPYLGFFDRFLTADLYVVLDHVEFGRRGWVHRDKIKTPTGEQWLTLNIAKSPRGTAINQIELHPDGSWRNDNLALLLQNYRSAPAFAEVFPTIDHLYWEPETNSLLEFNLPFLDWICGVFETPVGRILSSTLDPQGSSNDMLVDILRKVGATRYLSGVGARAYFQPEPFDSAGIEVVWQDFRHPVYPQQYGPFIPGLSAIDLLFNCGLQGAREVLRSTAR